MTLSKGRLTILLIFYVAIAVLGPPVPTLAACPYNTSDQCLAETQHGTAQNGRTATSVLTLQPTEPNGGYVARPSDTCYSSIGARAAALGWTATSLTYQTPSVDGQYQLFNLGSIYQKYGGCAWALSGLIYNKWSQLGWEQPRGTLGWPVSDQKWMNGYSAQFFERGAIYLAWWNNTWIASEMHGQISAKFQALEAQDINLGAPVTDETKVFASGRCGGEPCTYDTGIRYNDFSVGLTIDWRSDMGAHYVSSPIRDRWVELGRETSWIGMTLTDPITNDGAGYVNYFGHGMIKWTTAHAANYASPGATAVVDLRGGLRYNEVRQRGAHNTYARPETIPDVLTYHRIHSLELDIHPRSEPGLSFAVYHNASGLSFGSSSCRRLGDCLQQIKHFHDANPQHEVITVFLELTEPWVQGNLPIDLDALLTSTFGSALYTPGNLLASCGSNMQDALRNGTCRWPTLASLRGKLLCALMQGDASLSDFLNYQVYGGGMAFLAPSIGTYDDLYYWSSHPSVVMYNISKAPFPPDLAWNLWFRNVVTRYSNITYAYDTCYTSWGFPSQCNPHPDQWTWDAARKTNVNHLCTDFISNTPFTGRTSNDHGYPFQALSGYWTSAVDGDTGPLSELQNIFSLHVATGSLESTADDFYYLYTYVVGTGLIWSANIASQGYQAPINGYGCLMAARVARSWRTVRGRLPRRRCVHRRCKPAA